MIERYSRPAMTAIWSEENKYKAWLEVEILAVQAWNELGVIPSEDIKKIRENATFNIDRILEIEQETRHDVVAFTRAVSESLGEEKKWVHYGLTSTDVGDTAYGYLYKQANKILMDGLERMLLVLKDKAIQYQNTPCIGRTHGVHADISCFGLKFALWYDEINRQIQRFKLACEQIEIGKISGAVGTFANTPPFVQDYVCEKLGINSSNISTQTLQRDRHAFYMSTLSLIASTIEKMAVEVRHLQRTEVREAEESFAKGQKGSSAMPHKRNPISSENMAGCARVIRGYMLASFENIPLWHERDISHSSAERIIAPDATILLDYMLNRYANVLENLTVFEEKMLENIDSTSGVIFAQRVMTTLIEKKGLAREEAYDLVQPLAMQAWENRESFHKLLSTNEKVSDLLTDSELKECFDLQFHLKNVQEIYKRVGII